MHMCSTTNHLCRLALLTHRTSSGCVCEFQVSPRREQAMVKSPPPSCAHTMWLGVKNKQEETVVRAQARQRRHACVHATVPNMQKHVLVVRRHAFTQKKHTIVRKGTLQWQHRSIPRQKGHPSMWRALERECGPEIEKIARASHQLSRQPSPPGPFRSKISEQIGGEGWGGCWFLNNLKARSTHPNLRPQSARKFSRKTNFGAKVGGRSSGNPRWEWGFLTRKSLRISGVNKNPSFCEGFTVCCFDFQR